MNNFNLIEGELKSAGFRFGIVVSRFNDLLTANF